jgi:hypothetical protein
MALADRDLNLVLAARQRRRALHALSDASEDVTLDQCLLAEQKRASGLRWVAFASDQCRHLS